MTLSPALTPTSRVATASHYHRLEARRHELWWNSAKLVFWIKH